MLPHLARRGTQKAAGLVQLQCLRGIADAMREAVGRLGLALTARWLGMRAPLTRAPTSPTRRRSRLRQSHPTTPMSLQAATTCLCRVRGLAESGQHAAHRRPQAPARTGLRPGPTIP